MEPRYKEGESLLFHTRSNDLMNFSDRKCKVVETIHGDEGDQPMYQIVFDDASVYVFEDELRPL